MKIMKLALVTWVFLAWCNYMSIITFQTDTLAAVRTPVNYEHEEITATSHITEAECSLCNNAGLMGYYDGWNTIGILDLNTFDIYDLRILQYDDYGELIIPPATQQQTLRTSNNGLFVSTHAVPSRKYSESTIYWGDRYPEIDYRILSDTLCQDCLDKVLKIHNRSFQNYNMPPLVLLDFSTKEIYGMSRTQIGYSIRDFVVRMEHDLEDPTDMKTQILIFYTKEIYHTDSEFLNPPE